MGLIGQVLGMGGAARQIGEAVGDVAEVFVGNRAERDAADDARSTKSLDQFSAEFAGPGAGRFDRFVNALNRLPRPLMTIGTLGLFAYAMVEPTGFGRRMQGLALVPEPLWWLLGAIVSFYFGAREMHYQRARGRPSQAAVAAVSGLPAQPLLRLSSGAAPAARVAVPVASPDYNAAVEEWRARTA